MSSAEIITQHAKRWVTEFIKLLQACNVYTVITLSILTDKPKQTV